MKNSLGAGFFFCVCVCVLLFFYGVNNILNYVYKLRKISVRPCVNNYSTTINIAFPLSSYPIHITKDQMFLTFPIHMYGGIINFIRYITMPISCWKEKLKETKFILPKHVILQLFNSSFWKWVSVFSFWLWMRQE